MLEAAVTVRPAALDDARAIARVYVDTWRATYAGILPDAYLARLSVDRLERSWRSQIADDIVLVAEVDGIVVGFASGQRERTHDPFFRGEIATLYVHPQAQQCGAGRALVARMRSQLAARTWSPVLVWVLARNRGARAFYERLGALPVRRAREDVGGKVVQKIGYAWLASDVAQP